MSDETVRKEVTVSGRVQGVFFRSSLQEEAERRGVSGWAENTSEGDVRAALEGPTESVDAVIEWCRRGPSAADVNSVDVREGAPSGEAGFTTR
ncbi:acylphosphatase [soil metagenome]